MLTALAIKDVVLIDALRMNFAHGLCVLTGETGAGKSILLDSLGLALGLRAEASLVRSGATQASVVAEFDLSADHSVRQILQDNGLECEDQLILRRLVKADGGSRGFINDVAVSAGLLREVGSALLEIHGQHDERGLLNPRGHRALLDIFGGLEAQVENITSLWQAWLKAQEALANAKATLESDQRDHDYLSHAVEELRRLAAQPGEEAALAERRSHMMKGQKFATDIAQMGDLLEGSDGALARLRQAARWMERLANEHALFEKGLAALDRALVEAGEVEEALAQAQALFTFDPQELDASEARLFDLRAMARKHRVDPDALPDLADQLSERLALIDAGTDHLVRLEQACTKAQDIYAQAAQKLSAARMKAAQKLDKAVMAELVPLKLDAARFATVVASTDAGPEGADRVEFQISTNPGAPFAPLVKIASGGELSRFILALKVALAGVRGASTMIFDEIDRGVGGAVATAIGERLAKLAQNTQVLVVTHSPQVAARGQHQWRISKTSNKDQTRTQIEALDAEARREEIARMLSSADVTQEARAQAARLLGEAA